MLIPSFAARLITDFDRQFGIEGARCLLEHVYGDMPIMPIYYYTYQNLERETVKETYNLNLLDQVDLTQVVVTE